MDTGITQNGVRRCGGEATLSGCQVLSEMTVENKEKEEWAVRSATPGIHIEEEVCCRVNYS